MKRRFCENDGFVLVEGIAALVLISIMAVSVFTSLSMAARLMNKGNLWREEMMEAAVLAELGEEVDSIGQNYLVFCIDNSVEIRVPVSEQHYGTDSQLITIGPEG